MMNNIERMQLHKALLSAFPTRPALQQMVDFGLDENLDAIASNANLSHTVFELITWVEAHGRMEELINAASEHNPGNEQLQAFTTTFFPSETSTTLNASSASREQQDESIKIFFSYVRTDEKRIEQLQNQLSILKQQKLITAWYAQKMLPGQNLDEETRTHLNSARIILLLVSADFIASERQSAEVRLAMQRSDAGQAVVIPILLRPTAHIREASFGKLMLLPRNEKAITEWPNSDAAYAHVAEEIGEVVKILKKDSDKK